VEVKILLHFFFNYALGHSMSYIMKYILRKGVKEILRCRDI